MFLLSKAIFEKIGKLFKVRRRGENRRSCDVDKSASYGDIVRS
jgi:hypothetical protein